MKDTGWKSFLPLGLQGQRNFVFCFGSSWSLVLLRTDVSYLFSGRFAICDLEIVESGDSSKVGCSEGF